MAKDFSKLIGLIVEKYGTRAAFCKVWSKNPEYLSRRLNNLTEFDANDIIEIVELLGIDPRDISLYFLTPKVR